MVYIIVFWFKLDYYLYNSIDSDLYLDDKKQYTALFYILQEPLFQQNRCFSGWKKLFEKIYFMLGALMAFDHAAVFVRDCLVVVTLVDLVGPKNE